MIDVCLILEGTYPFVSGGVATWIHQLVEHMSDVRFSVLSISPFPNPRREFKYKIPSNVVDIQDVYLHDASDQGALSGPARLADAIRRLASVQDRLLGGDLDAFPEALPLLRAPGALSLADALQSEEAWEYMLRVYKKYAEDVSFLDYFWTCRSLLIPLLTTMRCALPPARLYHVVSTGYAGLLAAIAKNSYPSSVLLTEHGVYTHERLLEISQATWIYTPQRERFRVQQRLSYFKRVWLGFFDLLGRLTYRYADRIVTLYDGNRLKQIAAGAPPEKISIIPNGIDIELWRDLPRKPRSERARTVAFVGRVVPIKDVKTFLQAAKNMQSGAPGVEFLVLGPADEEPDYHRECLDLARSLGLAESCRFVGRVNMADWYPRIDVAVLTSLSEAQPYVILEANAVGVPVVATDVGACREMLEGGDDEDRALGPSGLLTGVAHPEETASAVLRLLNDADLWNEMSKAGRKRVQMRYDQKDLVSRYRNLYEQMMR